MIRLAVIGSREGFLGDPGTFIEKLIEIKKDLIIVSGGDRENEIPDKLNYRTT